MIQEAFVGLYERERVKSRRAAPSAKASSVISKIVMLGLFLSVLGVKSVDLTQVGCPEISLASFSHQISNRKQRRKRCEGIR